MAANIVLKRAFSVSNLVASQIVRPPVPVYGVEGKYAAALYSACYKQKTLDTADKDLKLVKDLYKTHKGFQLFVQDPTLNRQKKRKAVEAVLQSIGVSKESQNFFGVMAEGGRLNKLNAVCNSFETIMRAHRNELYVEVTSAEALSKKHEQSLNDALKKFATSGQKLHVSFSVKPSLIGGLVVTIGDRYVDMSVASRLKKLTTVLETAI